MLWRQGTAAVSVGIGSKRQESLTNGASAMTIETARSFFLWCTILNFIFLLVWVGVATLGRGPVHKLANRVFHLTAEQFDLLNICGITLYKMAIFLFNIVPCVALYIVK